MSKCVLILSGGLDSVVLLHYLKWLGYDVYGLSFYYGQRHKKELIYAEYWGKKLCSQWELVDLSRLNKFISNSSLTGDKDLYGDVNDTVVPNRNMIMLSVAVAMAENLNIGEVYFGANMNDFEVYPDCRQEFVYYIDKSSVVGTKNNVRVKAPFVGLSKSDIVKLGYKLGVDFSKTWTCYKGGEKHCGKCPSCLERINAFKEAGINDSVEYE